MQRLRFDHRPPRACCKCLNCASASAVLEKWRRSTFGRVSERVADPRYPRQMTISEVIHRDPEIMSGELVFVGTRVPVYTLFDFLEAGDSLDQFLDEFPSVTREQANA